MSSIFLHSRSSSEQCQYDQQQRKPSIRKRKQNFTNVNGAETLQNLDSYAGAQ